MRDDKRRIIGLAEEKTLVSDEAMVRDARAVLTNPRRRLAAEIGWLPGLGPKRVSKSISILEREPAKVRRLRRLPRLARANLLADGLIPVAERLPTRECARWIRELADTHDRIEVEQTTTILNEERSVAGFPAISSLQTVADELWNRRQYYRQAIKTALDQLPASSLVEVVTIAVKEATNNGSRQAPILIDDLVDGFADEAQGFFEKEKNNIDILVHALRSAAERDEGDERIGGLVSRLEEVVENWDRVAQPIQLSARCRGIGHDPSHQVAEEIRNVSVDLFNEHGLLDIAKQLTALQQRVFAEVDKVIERSEKDATALNEIAEQRSQFLAEMEARAESWRREITFEANLGLLKGKLRIAPDGVQWKGSKIPLDEIDRVRWGGTTHSINGIPTGTTYSIFVGSEKDSITIDTGKSQIYSEFVGRLWKTAGVAILTKMLNGLRAGKRYEFGTAMVTDHGVELEKRGFLGAKKRMLCKWKNLVIGNGAGTFYIAKKNEEKVAVVLPYQELDNIHVLEAAMRLFWKNIRPRLSDLLDEVN